MPNRTFKSTYYKYICIDRSINSFSTAYLSTDRDIGYLQSGLMKSRSHSRFTLFYHSYFLVTYSSRRIKPYCVLLVYGSDISHILTNPKSNSKLKYFPQKNPKCFESQKCSTFSGMVMSAE